MKKYSILLLAIVVCLAGTPVNGAGFSIFEQGAAATGMAGAFTARADDATAVFYNPAGITELEGTELSIGGTFILPEAEMTDPYGNKWDADSQTFFPPNFFVTHRFGDRLSLGFGATAPFGLGMKWDNNSDFIYREYITEVNLAAYYFNTVAAFRISDIVSIGGGLTYVRSEVDLSREIGLTSMGLPENGKMKLDADNGSGDFGWNLGVQARINQLRLGLVYRSSVECAYDGNADFTLPATGDPNTDAYLRSLFPNTGGSTVIELPATASFGIAYNITEKFSVEFDLNWMGWSSYEKLVIDFEDETSVLQDGTQIKDWDDVFSYRLGGRYIVNDAVEIYAGYLFDESPIPDKTLDPILPDADRHSVQIGGGYSIGALKLQASYMALFFDDRGTDTNYLGLNADYENFAHLIGLQISYNF